MPWEEYLVYLVLYRLVTSIVALLEKSKCIASIDEFFLKILTDCVSGIYTLMCGCLREEVREGGWVSIRIPLCFIFERGGFSL